MAQQIIMLANPAAATVVLMCQQGLLSLMTRFADTHRTTCAIAKSNFHRFIKINFPENIIINIVHFRCINSYVFDYLVVESCDPRNPRTVLREEGVIIFKCSRRLRKWAS